MSTLSTPPPSGEVAGARTDGFALVSALSAAEMPRVNLLPAEIEERRRLRRLQTGLGGLVLICIGAVAALTMSAHGQVNNARADLDAEKARTAGLQQQVTALQYVRDTNAKVDAARATLKTAMGSEVLWSSYLNDLSLTIPSNVWLTSLTVTQDPTTDASAAAATDSGKFGQPGVATVNVNGVGLAHVDVAAWLESLATEKGYADPYFSSSAEQVLGNQKVVNFASSWTVTADGLSHRYDDPAAEAAPTAAAPAAPSS